MHTRVHTVAHIFTVYTHTHAQSSRTHGAIYRLTQVHIQTHRCTRTQAPTHSGSWRTHTQIHVHIAIQKHREIHSHPHVYTDLRTQKCGHMLPNTGACMSPLRHAAIADAQIRPWALCTATRTQLRHTRLPVLAGHTCRHTPTPARTLQRSSWAPSPSRAHTPIYSCLWTVASGLDQGQGVGAGHTEAEADGAAQGWGEAG